MNHLDTTTPITLTIWLTVYILMLAGCVTINKPNPHEIKLPNSTQYITTHQ